MFRVQGTESTTSVSFTFILILFSYLRPGLQSELFTSDFPSELEYKLLPSPLRGPYPIHLMSIKLFVKNISTNCEGLLTQFYPVSTSIFGPRSSFPDLRSPFTVSAPRNM